MTNPRQSPRRPDRRPEGPAGTTTRQQIRRRRRRWLTLAIASLAAAGTGTADAGPWDQPSGMSAYPSGASAYVASANPTGNDGTANTTLTQPLQRLEVMVQTNRILTIDGRIPRFTVHNEAMLSATPISENQIQIYAKTPGTTQVNLWDQDDKLYTVEVTITADSREVEGLLSSQIPLAALRVIPVGESAILSGTVTNVDDVDRAVAIAEQFYTTIVNNVRVIGVQQVLLHAQIMEVSRTKLRELGIDIGFIGDDGVVFTGTGGMGQPVTSASSGLLTSSVEGSIATTITRGARSLSGLVEALSDQRLVKILAEPTVVATHGRPARFNVGGKVPLIVPSGGNNNSFTISYQEFGTSVDFLPFVVGPGRVRLEVRPEVTELDPSRAVVVGTANVSGFSTRYVETAVEMQSGQTMAIAGLLQARTDATVKALPFFGELPFIGAYFRRVEHQRNDVELLVTVTPELVSAMDPHEVPVGGPGLHSMDPDNRELFKMGHIEVPNMKAAECGTTVPVDHPSLPYLLGPGGNGMTGGPAGGQIIGDTVISESTVDLGVIGAPIGGTAVGGGPMMAPPSYADPVSPSSLTPPSVIAPPAGMPAGSIVEGY